MLPELCEEVSVTFNNNLGNDSEWFAGYSLGDAFVAGQSRTEFAFHEWIIIKTECVTF